MKIPVYVRDMNEMYGLFLGHAEHTELADIIQMFNHNPSSGLPPQLPEDQWLPLYLGEFDSDTYCIVDTQFAADRQGKNIVFEIVVDPSGAANA